MRGNGFFLIEKGTLVSGPDEHGGVKRRWRVCGRFKVVDEGGLAGVKDRAGGCASPAEPESVLSVPSTPVPLTPCYRNE